MTYFDLYLAALYDALQAGGTQAAIDRTIEEINNPTQAGLEAYLTGPAKTPCGVCGTPFSGADRTPKLDEEVLCLNCKPKANQP